jgi:hypothetical protein
MQLEEYEDMLSRSIVDERVQAIAAQLSEGAMKVLKVSTQSSDI